ncbi:translocation protein SEC66, partial [Lecanoromycetidae sp. Uapishka_2]
MVDLVGLAIPFAYLTILIGSLATFSSLYRKRKAEKEIEAELKDVVEEANALASNWGQTIFQSANEMVNNATVREKVAELQAKGKADREWWDKERASIKSKFMQELDEGKAAESAKSAASTSVNSDEDAVFVEGGGPASGTAAGSKGGTKKKKSKK